MADIVWDEEETDEAGIVWDKKPQKKPDAPAPIRTRSTGQKIADPINAYAQGLSLGWVDEGSAALEATMDMITGADDEILGADMEPLSWGDRRSFYADKLKEDRDIYSQENPKTAMGLEMAGGLHQAIATRKLPNTKLKLPGGPLAPGTKLGKRVGSEVARAGAEGATYGAGTAEEGDALGGAVRGATTDIAVNTGLKGLGKAAKPLVNSRVAQELKDKAGNFIPMNLADGGKLGDFYREYVMQTGPGGRKLGAQSEEALGYGRAGRELDRVQEKTSALPNTIAGEEAAAAARIATRKELSKDVANEQYDDVVKVIDDTATAEKLAADVEIDNLKVAATDSSQAATAAADSARRVEQASKTLPPHAPEELREFVSTTDDPTAVARAIDTWWQKEGFTGIKSTQFDVDDKLESFLARYVDEADLDELVDGGSISGGWLMDLRNNPARASGTAGDYARGKLRVDVKEFDGQMERMLKDMDSPEALEVLKQYKDELAFYGDKQAYVKAVDKAQTKRGGSFVGDDLATAGPKRQRRYGNAPGQVAGQQGQRAAAESKTALSQTRKQLDADKKARQADAKARASQYKKDAGDEKAAATRAADKQAKQDARKAKREIAAKRRRAEAAEKLRKSKADVRILDDLTSDKQARGIKGRILSASSPSMLRQGGRTALGLTGASNVLSSPGVQQLLAGQLSGQRKLAELIRKYDVPLEEARKLIGRYSAGQAGE